MANFVGLIPIFMKKVILICTLCLIALTMRAQNEVQVGYVDLGLSVKWATCNLGANQPEEFGDYFAWGETEPKMAYDWSVYKWCEGSHDSLTKYCTSGSYGKVDGKTVLDGSDDVAKATLGGQWRMPTDAEWTELRTKCNWTWTTQNDVSGYVVTSNINGNSIFLPAAGYRIETYLCDTGSDGYYWSSTLDKDPYYARNIYFNSGKTYRYGNYRFNGYSVRPVSK